MSEEDDKLAWGIIGTGRIAREFAAAIRHSQTGRLLGVASRSANPPEAEEFAGAKVHHGYEALLADPHVRAVYVAVPHPMHAEWAIRAAEAGKHILCEKPIGMNAAEAAAIVAAARRTGVFLMEAFMYRGHPQTSALIELLRSREIGDIRLMQASFGYRKPFDAASRQYDPALGGGGILDVGCYCVSMARLVAGVAAGGQLAEPVRVQGAGHLGSTGVDEWAVATLEFPGSLVAQLSTSVGVAQENVVRIFGTAGQIELHQPWFCSGREGGRSEIVVRPGSGEARVVPIETDEWLYAIEADHVAARLEQKQAAWPAPNWDDSIGNMKVLDAWRQAIGLQYPVEQPGGRPFPLSGRRLERRTGAAMPMTQVRGVAKQVSRLALGCMGFSSFAEASVLYDAFFEAGGTMFDTARHYKAGVADALLGHWMRSRGVRGEVTVIGKGGHTPNCDPVSVSQQVHESLDSLQTDCMDVYFLHRDNPAVPVGEFIDVLNEHRRAGRIGLFGGSNWTIARTEEANAYAARHGLTGMGALSNHFSLAEMIEPMWPGCIASSDAASVEWLRRTGTTLFAWSSQARGFFTDRARRDRQDDPLMVRTWYNDTNFARRERAAVLAERYGVSLMNVSLAYVLAQDFPVIPLVGPLTLDELHDSLNALSCNLKPEEARWLRDG